MNDDKKTTFKNETETETGTLTKTDIDTDIVTVNTLSGDDIEGADSAASYDSSAKKPIANMAVLDFETATSWSYGSFEFAILV